MREAELLVAATSAPSTPAMESSVVQLAPGTLEMVAEVLIAPILAPTPIVAAQEVEDVEMTESQILGAETEKQIAADEELAWELT